MRLVVALAVTLWLTPVFAAGAYAFAGSAVPSIVIGAALGAAVAAITRGPLSALLQPLAGTPVILALTGLLAVVAIAGIARISVYMANPARVDCSYDPDPWRVRHSCMTAYAEAVRFAAARDGNIYEMARYEPRMIGPLKVDSYHYPPVFLLLPAAVHAIRGDIFGFRAVWFVMQALALAGCIFGVARWIGGRPGAYAAAGGVAALATPQMIYSLQQGNVQSTAMPVAALAFALVAAGRVAAGAPLLAYFAAAKIFPGVLLVYLAAARRWRALAWIAACGLVLVLLTAAIFGLQPFEAFVRDELPRIANGAAFPQSERPDTVHANLSVYGLTVRARALGAAFLDQRTGLAIASVYGLGVLALAALAGWRTRIALMEPADRLRLVQLALGLLSLASFRSPFVGFYGYVATVWLLTLLAADARTPRTLVLGWGVAGAFSWAQWLVPAVGPVPTRFTVIGSALLFVFALAVNAVTVVRAMREARPARLPGAEPAAIPA